MEANKGKKYIGLALFDEKELKRCKDHEQVLKLKEIV